MADNPDLTWYSRLSRDCNGPVRCPFATVEACPRYYQSLALSGNIGATSISSVEDKRLLKKWKKSDLWPRIDEQASSVFKVDNNLSFISNFCPEVSYDVLGVFCSGLSTYADEFDREVAYQHLKKEGAVNSDPRWLWQHVEPQHYSSCPIYAILNYRAEAANYNKNNEAPWWREHLEKIIVAIIGTIATAIVMKILS